MMFSYNNYLGRGYLMILLIVLIVLNSSRMFEGKELGGFAVWCFHLDTQILILDTICLPLYKRKKKK